MSHRISTIAAAAALSLAAIVQAHATTLNTTILTPVVPRIVFTCYTRVFLAPNTDGTLIKRQCAAGERPGTVTVVYAG